MDACVGWFFVFRLTGPGPIPRPVADALMGEALGWAERHDLGVGGGYHLTPAGPGGEPPAWSYQFGLSAADDGPLVPRHKAEELAGVLRAWAERHGVEWRGGFRPFASAESGGGAAGEPASSPCQAPG